MNSKLKLLCLHISLYKLKSVKTIPFHRDRALDFAAVALLLQSIARNNCLLGLVKGNVGVNNKMKLV